MYMDTCIEPWLGGYTDQSVSPSHRSTYGCAKRCSRCARRYPHGGPTVIPTHGANPGLVSHWVKQAMVNIARDIDGDVSIPKSRQAWPSSA